MTLKEKFKPFAMDNHIEKYAEHNAKVLEQIADDYAIEFAEWCNNNFLQILGKKLWTKNISMKNVYNAKELLEIFKKGKGL
jgi:hypothetical protein